MPRELLVLLIVFPVVVPIHAIVLHLANRNVTADTAHGRRQLLVNRLFTAWHAVAFSAAILAAIFLRDRDSRQWALIPLGAHLLAVVGVWSAVLGRIRRSDSRQAPSQGGPGAEVGLAAWIT